MAAVATLLTAGSLCQPAMAATDIHAPQFTKGQVSRYLAHHPEARNYLREHPEARAYLRRHIQGHGSTPLGPQARMAVAGVGESLTPIYGYGKSSSVTVVPQSGTFPASAPPMLDGIVVDFTDVTTGRLDGTCTLTASVPGPASCDGPALTGGDTESVSVDPSSQLPTGFIAPIPATIAVPWCFPGAGPSCSTVSAELQLPGTWRPVGLSVTNRATGQPVPGVTYVLCAPSASDPTGSAGDCPTGTVAEDSATSDTNGSVQFSGLYPAGPGYRVLAAAAPGGYIWDRDPRPLDVPAVTDPANAGEAFVASMSLAPQPPSLTDDTVSVPENTTSAVQVLGNDSGGLTLGQVTEPAHGDTSFADGSITYRPNTGFVGTDTFTYTASNVYGGTATATVTVTVTDVAPSVASVKVSTKENQATSIDPMATVTTPEGATANVTDVSKPKHGTATYGSSDSGAGELVYTPKPGFVGTDYYYYTVSDAHGATATAKVTITVTDVAPRARRVRVTTHAGTPVAIAPLAKVQAPTGARLTVSRVEKPGHGSVTLTHGKLVYTPDAGFTGRDHFIYTVTDRHGGSADASVAIKVKRPMRRHGRRS